MENGKRLLIQWNLVKQNQLINAAYLCFAKEIDINNIEKTNRSIPRNKKIAYIFNKLGLIEGWGTGLLRIIHESINFGLPSPEFNHHQGAFIIRLKKHVTSDVTDDVTDNRLPLILKLIKGNNKITTSNIAELLNISKRTVLRDIGKLKIQNKLQRVGNEHSGY